MLHALQWLLANNIYYRNICIDSYALALLPEDMDLTGLCSMTLESSDDDQELPSPQDINPYDAPNCIIQSNNNVTSAFQHVASDNCKII